MLVCRDFNGLVLHHFFTHFLPLFIPISHFLVFAACILLLHPIGLSHHPWQLSEMEESILAIETHIDPLTRSPHPKPADSWQKIKGDKKKSQPSALFFSAPPLRYHNYQQYRSLLHTLVPPFSFLMMIPAIFHLTLFTPDNISSTSDVTFLCVCSTVQHFF